MNLLYYEINFIHFIILILLYTMLFKIASATHIKWHVGDTDGGVGYYKRKCGWNGGKS